MGGYYPHSLTAPTAIAMVSSVVQSCPHGITVSWLIFEPSAINGPPSETSLRIDVFGGEDNRTIAIGYQEAGVSGRVCCRGILVGDMAS